jgi:MoxR-like ATPase
MNQDSTTLDASAIAEALERVHEAVATRVIGQRDAVSQALVAVLARGHVLLEGVPGVAKTLLVRALAGALGARFGRIQFTPDLVPSDVTGVSVFREAERRFEFVPGPVFTDLLLADEINRAPAKTQSALLEAMQERQVTVDGEARPLGPLFTVFATQNPVEYEGTYPLPEAQLDRFLLKVRVPYPTMESEVAILDLYAEGFDPELPGGATPAPVLGEGELERLRTAVEQVHVSPDVRRYVAEVVRATRNHDGFTLGASPRATVALFRASRAAALLEGRDFVTPDDVKSLVPAVLRHRVMVAPELEVEGRTADDVLADVLLRVKVPE